MGYDRDYGRGNRSPYQSYDRDDRERYRGRDYGRGGRDDRGFLERAGDELRSWFGDEDAERRRDQDERMAERYEREYRPRDYDRDDFRDRDRMSRYGAVGAGGYGARVGRERYGQGGYSPMAGDYGRGVREESGYGRSAYSQQGYGQSGYGQRQQPERSRYGEHDYDRWRNQQIDSLDRDYEEYRRENQSRFDSEFSAWRNRRETQRSCLARVNEHMEVVGSDGEHLGTVDKVRGDRIILTKSDASSEGHHHSIPSLWIDEVDDKVKLIKSSAEARDQWRDEDRRQAMFHDDDDRSDGPHMLNRSFSGTY